MRQETAVQSERVALRIITLWIFRGILPSDTRGGPGVPERIGFFNRFDNNCELDSRSGWVYIRISETGAKSHERPANINELDNATNNLTVRLAADRRSF